jgi:hypothetical protein
MSTDKKTLDICEMDLAGPVPPKPTARDKARARAARFADKHGQALTIHLPVEQLAAFEAYCQAKDRKKSAVISKLIASQLLRKR